MQASKEEGHASRQAELEQHVEQRNTALQQELQQSIANHKDEVGAFLSYLFAVLLSCWQG